MLDMLAHDKNHRVDFWDNISLISFLRKNATLIQNATLLPGGNFLASLKVSQANRNHSTFFKTLKSSTATFFYLMPWFSSTLCVQNKLMLRKLGSTMYKPVRCAAEAPPSPGIWYGKSVPKRKHRENNSRQRYIFPGRKEKKREKREKRRGFHSS